MEKNNLFIFNFKKYLFLLVLSGIFFMLSVWVINKVLEEQIIFKSEISGAAKINRILTENHLEEIPIFGSSRANGSYVPSILGEIYYNYGINGTHSNIWLFFLQEELKKDKKGPIIINLDLEGFQGSTGSIDNYIPHSNNKDLQVVLKEVNTTVPSGPFRYYGSIQNYLKYYLNERTSLTKAIDRGGAFEKDPITATMFQRLVEQREKAQSSFLVYDSIYQRLMRTLLKTNRKIVFVVAPCHKSYFVNFVNLEVAEVFIERLDKLDNCTVLNYSKLQLPDSLYANTTHLNFSGAQYFSKILRKDLGGLKVF